MSLSAQSLHRWATTGAHRAHGQTSATGLLIVCVVLGPALTLTGCQPVQTGFDSPAPTKRIDAIVEASDLDDPQSLGKLIEQLESPDPAARMLAIRALEQRTGKTFGYNHAAPRWERIEPINAWFDHLADYSAQYAEQSANGEPAPD
ncbi:MAG: hypothetical protein JKY96_03240 [Phycisphaerales bacterium]|nr:hypothetical protein [Phycisphaerales bacterium]